MSNLPDLLNSIVVLSFMETLVSAAKVQALKLRFREFRDSALLLRPSNWLSTLAEPTVQQSESLTHLADQVCKPLSLCLPMWPWIVAIAATDHRKSKETSCAN